MAARTIGRAGRQHAGSSLHVVLPSCGGTAQLRTGCAGNATMISRIAQRITNCGPATNMTNNKPDATPGSRQSDPGRVAMLEDTV
ncbi:hypothetical protein C7410_11438 [Paraburkholderia silvatlantica]|uniref:Uncharacterized protein n=1 Tax=Paraburkholderia silvatlantica TaxID=321895 RepID=A0A2V4UAK4_9BURK|nr:hypothetical protein C7410_11438 [Paraburkholderia silvatlantica]TDQ92363.1 hypothetical protein C7412_112139 [Paraburkholderia silvatlantica]